MIDPTPLNPYATHLPTLLTAVSLTTGPVLEVGCGYFSTFCLHGFCRQRKLVSVETHADWFNRFKCLRSDDHALHFGHNYDAFADLFKQPWDVVLIDHAPAWRRAVEVRKLTHARFVVMHDTEAHGYEWHTVLPLFRYTFTDRRRMPWTTVASNTDPLDAFKGVPVGQPSSGSASSG